MVQGLNSYRGIKNVELLYMSLITDSSVFIINSADRISGTNGNFQYKIDMPKNSGYDRVCLLQALIPKSYYLVASPFNTFTLSENGVNTLITVTPGNYNVRSWITLMGALLTTSSSQGYVYAIAFPNSLRILLLIIPVCNLLLLSQLLQSYLNSLVS
jgi:hypothetical protein